MVENSLKLAAWLVSGKSFCMKEFQKTLSQIPDEKTRYLIMTESAWRKWASWCLEQKIDPFQTPVKDIIEYLTFLFNYSNEYRTISLHMSAISAFHEYINGLLVGKHPRICSLVYGVFNLRPPKPVYMSVWDIYLFVFGDNDQLLNKELKLKVTILLALTASSRISALHIFDLNHMMKTSKYYEFKFHKIYAFPSDKALYVVAGLDCYIERTSV